MASGIPVVITDRNGIPVTPVSSGAPLMTVAANGLGTPIVITDNGAPFIVDGYSAARLFSALSADDGANLVDDDQAIMETYGDGNPT